jgi:hypothetical protein
MTDVLERLARLRSSLVEPLTNEGVANLWPTVQLIESALSDEKERGLMRRVRSTITDVISAHRDGLPSPPVSSAVVAIGALDGYIRRRTTGVDGWPLA